MGHILALGFHGLERRRRGAGRRRHYDYEQATARWERLPESLGCTTDYRHETAAPRRTPPRSGRRRPPPHRSRVAAASIHSLHTQLFIRAARWTRTRSSPPRERATRARPPPRRCAPARGAERPPPRARPPRTHCRQATPTLPANFETLPSII